MKPKGPAAPALSGELKTILMYGPWDAGLTLNTMPPHDVLCAAWRRHETEIRASMPRGKEPWIVGQIWWVDLIQGKDV